MRFFNIKKVLLLYASVMSFAFCNTGVVFAQTNPDFIYAANHCQGSVVNIIIYKKTAVDNKHFVYTSTAYGSGVIISAEGYLVTNYHVVNKGSYYRIILSDGSEVSVATLGNGKYYIEDKKTDIAVMKLDLKGNRSVTPIPFGDSQKLQVGEWVLAVGNPFGLHQSVTSGIVSAKGRTNIGFAEIEDFIQTDVPINPGNSGGPLLNCQGEMVGLNTAIRTNTGSYQGISFAIPSNLVRKVAFDLLQYGEVKRGWLGFVARERISDNRRIDIEILSIIKGSPAETCGLRPGDIIIELDGVKINNLAQLTKLVSSKPLGTNMRLAGYRNREQFFVDLILREKGSYQQLKQSLDEFYQLYGAELGDNSNGDGVLVSGLSPVGSFYQSGVVEGDLIVGINGKKIIKMEEFILLLNKSGKNINYITIRRNGVFYNLNIVDVNFTQP